MAMKKSLWDMILKVVIAVASAVAGVLGANAMRSATKISVSAATAVYRNICGGLSIQKSIN